MPVNLTRNAIASINTGDVNSKPLVQVVDIKLIGNSQERYRFLLSDSESSQHAMLATQLNEQVRTGRVKKGSIIQLIDYVCSTVQNRRIIVVLNMETIIPEYEIIGNPKLLTDSDSTTNKSLPSLTRNAIAAINTGDVNSKPLVQVVDIKLIGNSQERYRFLLSDSESSQHAMLATQLNEQVRTGRVKKGSIIQLIDYVCSTVQNRRIIVVLNMETIIPEYEIIGNPKLLTDSDSTTNKSLPSLTRNAIASINAGDVNSKPLVQVVDIKLIGNSQERYRFLLSDTEFSQHAMLATQLNEQVRTGRVKKGSIIQLTDYVCSTVQNRRIIVVLNMETIIPEYEIIGNPKLLTDSDSTTNKSLPNLTRNAIVSINAGDVNSKPLVQVVGIKLIGNSQERYRFLLSDSESSQHAMLATQLNEQVRTGRVKKGSIIQLIDYVCSTVQNRRIIVVLNMEAIIPEYEIIGNPKLLMDSDSTTNKSLPFSKNIETIIPEYEIIERTQSHPHPKREKGRRIRELTSVVQKRFKFPENSVELYAEKVNNRGICAIAQAESSLQASRRACYGVLRFIMESGAKGCEVIVSGKLRAQRAKSMKFKDGYMISSGHPVNEYIDSAVRHVLLRQGVLGIKVKIMLDWDPKGKQGPTTPLPDLVTIHSPKGG
ncbi:hypothetical protein SCA6_011878 [Theobroma cacao]